MFVKRKKKIKNKQIEPFEVGKKSKESIIIHKNIVTTVSRSPILLRYRKV